MMNTVNSNSCLNKLSAVGREELKVAIKVASYWLTAKLKGRTDRGPLSEASLGEPARLYFLKRACVSLWSGDWKWKPELKLSTQLIRIMKSDMSHVIRNWYKRDVPKKVYLEEY